MTDCSISEIWVTPLLNFLDNNNLTTTVRTSGELGGQAITSDRINVFDFIVSKHTANDTVSTETVNVNHGVRKEKRTRYRRKDIEALEKRKEGRKKIIKKIKHHITLFMREKKASYSTEFPLKKLFKNANVTIKDKGRSV